jgi:hypothetical protein
MAIFFVFFGAFPLRASTTIDVQHDFSLTVGNQIPAKTTIYSHGYYFPDEYNTFPIDHFEYIDSTITSAQIIYDDNNQLICSSTLSRTSVFLKTQYPVSQGVFNWLTFDFNAPTGGYLLNIKDTWTYHYILNGEASYYSYALLKIDDNQYFYPWAYLNEHSIGNIDSGIISSYVDFSLYLPSGYHCVGFYSGTSQTFVPIPNTMFTFGAGLIILFFQRRNLNLG